MYFLLSLFLGDLWGFYGLAFVGLGWYTLIADSDGNALLPFHQLASVDGTVKTYWVILALLAGIAACGAFARWVAADEFEGHGKAKRPPYPYWYSASFAIVGLINFVYFLFPLRSYLESTMATVLAGSLNPSVLEPNFIFFTIDMFLVVAIPLGWVSQRAELETKANTAAVVGRAAPLARTATATVGATPSPGPVADDGSAAPK